MVVRTDLSDDETDRVFQALAAATRRDILRRTIAEEQSVSELAAAYDCAVLLSGEEDIVADGRRAAAITGGSPLTPLVTGTGCMLSVLCGAFAAVEPNAFDAALMASGGGYAKLYAAQKALEEGYREDEE